VHVTGVQLARSARCVGSDAIRLTFTFILASHRPASWRIKDIFVETKFLLNMPVECLPLTERSSFDSYLGSQIAPTSNSLAFWLMAERHEHAGNGQYSGDPA
jgi:hypothetical protein